MKKQKHSNKSASKNIQRVAKSLSRKYIELREGFVTQLSNMENAENAQIKLAAAYRKDVSDKCELSEWIRTGDFKRISKQTLRMSKFLDKHKMSDNN